MANLTFEYDFPAFRKIRALLVLFRVYTHLSAADSSPVYRATSFKPGCSLNLSLVTCHLSRLLIRVYPRSSVADFSFMYRSSVA